jgi:hypothetical protein
MAAKASRSRPGFTYTPNWEGEGEDKGHLCFGFRFLLDRAGARRGGVQGSPYTGEIGVYGLGLIVFEPCITIEPKARSRPY